MLFETTDWEVIPPDFQICSSVDKLDQKNMFKTFSFVEFAEEIEGIEFYLLQIWFELIAQRKEARNLDQKAEKWTIAILPVIFKRCELPLFPYC